MLQTKIIPTIFSTDVQTFNSKLNTLKEFAKTIHLDFMDGEFVEGKSIEIPQMSEILNYPTINFQIHLMANNPIKYLEQIKNLKIKTVLIQFSSVESEIKLRETIEEFIKNKIKVVLVLNPNENPAHIHNFTDIISGVMVMSVYPGKEGQEFIEKSLEKTNYLRENFPNLNIQVDGGIKDLNARRIAKFGANLINVGSYITSSKTPQENFEKLNYLVKR